MEYASPQAATAAKHYIDQVSADEAELVPKKTSASYWNPSVNPFRTLPKDAPARVKEQPRAAPTGPYNDRGNYSGGFRGRGGYGGGRGGMNQPYNRNFNNNNNNSVWEASITIWEADSTGPWAIPAAGALASKAAGTPWEVE